MSKELNNAPDWANGTFIWRINLADSGNSLDEAEGKIREVHNLTDGALRQIIFINGAVGVDEGYFPWDGSWPYWGRPTYRINHDWKYLAGFMKKMKEKYNTWISFHVNITDVNVGLCLTEETRKFFEKLRDNKCIFARPQGSNAQPWFGLPYVPQEIPVYKEIDGKRVKQNASDMFAMVDYKQLWDTGIAKEIIDGLFSKLPFVPPLLYVDVFGPRGWCIHPGYPDGELGHSYATQLEGMRLIRDYIRKCGSDVAGESPERLTDLGSDYSWSHGGLSANDYSKIGAGFGMGAMEKKHGAKGMHVYGNQGGYHLHCGEKFSDNMQKAFNFESKAISREYDGIREWGDTNVVAKNFYLTVIQELCHIGRNNCKLPAGQGFNRLDEHCGRAKINAITVTKGKDFNLCADATSANLAGSCVLEDDTWAVGGKTAADLNQALFNSINFKITVPEHGDYDIFLRYSSVGGAEVTCLVNGTDRTRLNLPDTEGWHFYGDFMIRKTLNAGENIISIIHDKIFAKWSDGTEAVWDHDGLRIWNSEVVFAENGNRMWPDSWSGKKRLFFYSAEGCNKSWKLPVEFAKVKKFTLYKLTAEERIKVSEVKSESGNVSLKLESGTPYVLVPCI